MNNLVRALSHIVYIILQIGKKHKRNFQNFCLNCCFHSPEIPFRAVFS